MATFTGFAGGRQAGSPIVKRADNGLEDITHVLSATVPIDTVVVQVCRHSTINPGPFDYCGPRVTIDRRINATS